MHLVVTVPHSAEKKESAGLMERVVSQLKRDVHNRKNVWKKGYVASTERGVSQPTKAVQNQNSALKKDCVHTYPDQKIMKPPTVPVFEADEDVKSPVSVRKMVFADFPTDCA